MRRVLVVPLAFALLICFGGSAAAQIDQKGAANARPQPDPAGPHVTNAKGADYDVNFDADALEATLTDGTLPRIVCRPVKGFALLTRPRTHFVPELLKSVESI